MATIFLEILMRGCLSESFRGRGRTGGGLGGGGIGGPPREQAVRGSARPTTIVQKQTEDGIRTKEG